MKKFYLILSSLFLFGCSSSNETPSLDLKIENRQIEMMGRHEVINAIGDCRSANLRPVMIYSRIKVNNHVTPIVIDITCATTGMIRKGKE